MSRSHIGGFRVSQGCSFSAPWRQNTTYALRPGTSDLRPGTRDLRNYSKNCHSKKQCQKVRKKRPERRGQHAIRSCQAVFARGSHLPPFGAGAHFWPPFWSLLGTQVRHYTPFWAPGSAKGGPKGDGKNRPEKVHAGRNG